MQDNALTRLRSLRPATVLAEIAAHAVLLGTVLWGDLPYLMLHAVIGVELVLINLLSAPFYRRWKQHALDTVRSIFLVALLLVLLGAGWMIMSGNGEDVASLLRTGIDVDAFGWAAAYVAAHLVFTALQAATAPEPRFAWIRAVSASGAASMLATIAMVFLTFFLGFVLPGVLPGAEALDRVLAVLTVAVRFPIALLAATMTDAEHRKAAKDPWRAADSG